MTPTFTWKLFIPVYPKWNTRLTQFTFISRPLSSRSGSFLSSLRSLSLSTTNCTGTAINNVTLIRVDAPTVLSTNRTQILIFPSRTIQCDGAHSARAGNCRLAAYRKDHRFDANRKWGRHHKSDGSMSGSARPFTG